MKAYQLGKVFLLCALPLTLAISACSKKDENSSSAIVTGRDARTGGPLNTSSGSFSAVNGLVYDEYAQNDEFSNSVRKFLSTELSPQDVGYVNPLGSDDTGFFFAGHMITSIPVDTNSFSQNLMIQANSELYMQIHHKFQNGTSTMMALMGPSTGATVSGNIQGTRANITLNDSAGSVRLNGTISRNYFYGTFTYSNTKRYDGGPGSSGTVGNFMVPTCEFFQCR